MGKATQKLASFFEIFLKIKIKMSALSISPDLLLDPIKLLLNPFIQPIFVPVLYLILDSIGFILSSWSTADRATDEQRRDSVEPETYDFIIGMDI